MRVIFFLGTKFNKRDYLRLGIDIIQKRGYRTEVWDFTQWWKPRYANNYNPPDPIKVSGYKELKNITEIKEAITKLCETDYVVDPFGIYSIVANSKVNGIKIGSMVLGLLPKVRNKHPKKSYILRFTKNPFKSLMQAITKLTKHYKYSPRLDFLLTGGLESQNYGTNKIDKNTDIIKAHAFDYDRYLEQEKKEIAQPIIQDSPYAVFLDEDMCYHPDYVHHGIDPHCSENVYYPEINDFFKEFKQVTGMKVVIAAHPRADYAKRGNPFRGSEIIVGNTAALVKHSKVVIGHMSTSMNFAVLYKKPIILINSNHYAKVLKDGIHALALSLHLYVINISTSYIINLANIKVTSSKYNNYKNLYIKESGTTEKFIWDIFCDYLDTKK